jgi:enoyl-[acyl-carrier protein] reductase III
LSGSQSSGVTRDLEGKVALVTGGGRGIGRAITLGLARRGANVVICYLRNRRAAEETCSSVEEHAVKALSVRANVGDESHIDRLFETIHETFGRLDVLVSNAATGVMRELSELDARAWDWTMNANARAFFLCAKNSVALMPAGGSMVALSSGGARRVLPGYTIVGASKAAIESLARYLSVELAPNKIRVNVVSPGVVDTEALRYFPERESMLADAIAKAPSGRLATPEDVARAVDFLTSESASMVTGHSLVVDGATSLVA